MCSSEFSQNINLQFTLLTVLLNVWYLEFKMHNISHNKSSLFLLIISILLVMYALCNGKLNISIVIYYD